MYLLKLFNLVIGLTFLRKGSGISVLVLFEGELDVMGGMRE